MIKVGSVKMIPLSSIILGDRIRENMGDLQGIEDSMKESGLISPLAVKQIDDEKYLLLAGGRRFSVLQKNQVETVPARIYEQDISDIEVKSIELAENLYRKDLEYWEHDALVREIHELHQQIHGPAVKGVANKGHSLSDTADIVGISKNTVSQAIIRDRIRQSYPGLFEKCKTQSDATKIIKKIDESVVKDQIARKLEQESSGTTFEKLSKCFIIGDFFDCVKKIPDGAFQLTEIDPPYSLGLMDKKKSEGESKYIKEDYNEVEQKDYPEFLDNLFKECFRVMAEHSWLICWFAPEPWFEVVRNSIVNAGFQTTRITGQWIKAGGQSMRPDIYLANAHEDFFYAWKGRPALNKAGSTNIFQYPTVPPQQKTHPTERPIDLMKDIYETFAFPGSRVLIPFLGSGSGLIAAHQLGMSGIGFELTKSYRDSFLVRINGM